MIQDDLTILTKMGKDASTLWAKLQMRQRVRKPEMTAVDQKAKLNRPQPSAKMLTIPPIRANT